MPLLSSFWLSCNFATLSATSARPDYTRVFSNCPQIGRMPPIAPSKSEFVQPKLYFSRSLIVSRMPYFRVVSTLTSFTLLIEPFAPRIDPGTWCRAQVLLLGATLAPASALCPQPSMCWGCKPRAALPGITKGLSSTRS